MGLTAILHNRFLIVLFLMEFVLMLHMFGMMTSMWCGLSFGTFVFWPVTRTAFSLCGLLSTVAGVIFYCLHYLLIFWRSNGGVLLPRKWESPIKGAIIAATISASFLAIGPMYDLIVYGNSWGPDQPCYESEFSISVQEYLSPFPGLLLVFVDITFAWYFIAYVLETKKHFGKEKRQRPKSLLPKALR